MSYPEITSGNEIRAPRGRGRVTRVEELEELRRMRDGVKLYVSEALAKGFKVSPLLTKYVAELETTTPEK